MGTYEYNVKHNIGKLRKILEQILRSEAKANAIDKREFCKP